jgi:S1-C subfamily serine protease
MQRRILMLAPLAMTALPTGPGFGFERDPVRGVLTLAPVLRPVLASVAHVRVVGGPVAQTPLLPDRAAGGEGQAEAERRLRRGSGSGVVIDATRGLLLTNHHVIDLGAEFRVRLPDGRDLVAEVLGSDEVTDVALLRIPADRLTAVRLGDSDALEVGDLAIAVGHPFGLDTTTTVGVISGLNRRRSGGNPTNFIQTDAPINPGNSGGPLLDSRGMLIGLNTWIITGSARDGSLGIGFAVPVRIALAVSEQLLAFGEVRRGRLGIEIDDVGQDLAAQLGLNAPQGALVRAVGADGAGARIGLRVGDVVTEAAGVRISIKEDLINVVSLAQPDSRIMLVVRRGRERLTLEARTEAAPDPNAGPRLHGAQFAPLSQANPMARYVRGVMVRRVAPGSPAAREGLRPGDVVTHVDGQPVPDLAQLSTAVAGHGRPARLTTLRGNSEFTVVLALP